MHLNLIFGRVNNFLRYGEFEINKRDVDGIAPSCDICQI